MTHADNVFIRGIHVKRIFFSFLFSKISQYYRVSQGNPSCCSDTAVGYHYVDAPELYALDYFIYHVHPFGVDDHSNEILPTKLSLKEIIAASDKESVSPNFRKHKIYHDLESTEKT